tara:strand:+ start:2027 stop:2164 length:138 start_codon:yes stop_codon:yes gene_type:complete
MIIEIIHSIISCVGAVTILYGAIVLGNKVGSTIIAKIITSNNNIK